MSYVLNILVHQCVYDMFVGVCKMCSSIQSVLNLFPTAKRAVLCSFYHSPAAAFFQCN